VIVRALLAAGVLLLSACSVLRPEPRVSPTDAPLPAFTPASKGAAGGVFSSEMPWTLVSDNRAFRPGDVLTVLLQETTQASKSADTSFDKKNSVGISPTVVGGSTLKSDVSVSAERGFAGKSSSTQQNALAGSITLLVMDVLPNGLLRVSGEKRLRLNQGEEVLRVTGFVRAADIDTDNRVSSQRIANADITYSGHGALSGANNPGWLSRFFASTWMPF
jgi:flagellar L-ring protein precursor FlgH